MRVMESRLMPRALKINQLYITQKAEAFFHTLKARTRGV
jgi:hypothetical protein